jgi:histidinol phosphatase-like PHP family hydrolase
MSDLLTELAIHQRGAKFYRGDLHVHSFGASHDVQDISSTPEAIVREAIVQRLDFLALTDHNEIRNVPGALAAASGRIVVVPGVELSTPEGHLLCYARDFDALERFWGKLTISDRGTDQSHCQTAMLECLNRLHDDGGFALLAHVDGDGGYETKNPGASPHKKNVICHPALLGIELKRRDSAITFSRTDPDQARQELGRERIRRLKLGQDQFLGRVLSSDAHSLTELGRNAAGDRKVTRYKMGQPTFDGLRIALHESDARVRLEEEVPNTIPAIVGLRFRGGFLDGEAIHFGTNLNCIIGGRGTGKSTAFEALRCLAQQPGGTKVVDSDVWPDEVELAFQDQSGSTRTVRRTKFGEVTVGSDPDELAQPIELECYGQGETHTLVNARSRIQPRSSNT